MDDAAADELLLHLHEEFTRDDGFMAVLYIILRNNAVVLYSFLGEKVSSIGLLQEGIADIFFIPQYLVNVAGVPFFSSSAVQNTISLKATGYL